MSKKIFKLVLIAVYIFSLACASKRVVSDDDFGVDSTSDSISDGVSDTQRCGTLVRDDRDEARQDGMTESTLRAKY